MSAPNALPAIDLEYVAGQTHNIWKELDGKRIFLSGGTGFFGRWLTESILFAIDRLGLSIEIALLTRREPELAAQAPHIARHKSVRIVPGDVRTFAAPPGNFDFVIHGATESSHSGGSAAQHDLLDIMIAGTQRMLGFAAAARASKFLFISSGAVYGVQPPDVPNIDELHSCSLNPIRLDSTYGEGKRAGEILCATAGNQHGFAVTSARCFAFVGAHLPLDRHFAIGNFIGNRLRGEPIVVNGDGSPYRSYMYAADLAIWLWTLLARGEDGRAYNVGSDEGISISDLAKLVAELEEPHLPVVIKTPADRSAKPSRYVPSTRLAQTSLALAPGLSLREGVMRTLRWHRSET